MFYYFENKKNRHSFLHSCRYNVASRLEIPVHSSFSYSCKYNCSVSSYSPFAITCSCKFFTRDCRTAALPQILSSCQQMAFPSEQKAFALAKAERGTVLPRETTTIAFASAKGNSKAILAQGQALRGHYLCDSKGSLDNKKRNLFYKKRSLQESINGRLFAISNNISHEYKQRDDKSFLFKNKKRKKNYTSYSKLSEIKLITIGIASPLRILQWAEKTLPNGKIYGEVLNANTLHHKTFKPQKGGLFCERIFGPLKDFECACGKVDKSVKKVVFSSKITDKTSFNSKKDKTDLSFLNENATGLGQALAGATVSEEQKQLTQAEFLSKQKQDFSSRKYCPDCDVEYTWSVIRRYQLGYIKLSSPVTHIWFLKGTPSYLSLLLDMKKRYLQFVTYCSETLTIEKSSLPFYTNNDSFLETLSSFKNPSGSLQTTFDGNSSFLQSSSSATSLFLTESKGSPKGLPERLRAFPLERKAFASTNGEETNDKLLLLQKEKNYLLENNTKTLQEINGSKNQENITPAKKKQQNLKKPTPKKGWSLYTLKNKNKEITIKQGAIVLSTFLLSVSFNKNLKKYNYNVFLPITLKNSEFLFEKTDEGKSAFPSERKAFVLSSSEAQIGKVQGKSDKSLFKQRGKAFSAKKEKLVKNFLDTQITFEANSLGNSVSNVDRTTLQTMLLKENNFKEFDNQRLSNNSHASHVKKVSPKLFSFAKKLPLDLYILFSIERFVHKSSVRLSIQKTWESIYKQAFLKTIQKAKIVFKHFSGINFSSTKKSKALYCYSYESKQNLNNFLNKGIKQQTSAKILRTLNTLQMLKRKYNLHVLKSLQSLKQPIFSLSHTTVFSKKNSFIDLENRISLEIEKYLTKNTNLIQDSLIDSFLKSLILDQFLNMYNRIATVTQRQNLWQEGKDKNKLKSLLLSYKNYSSLNSVNFEQIINFNFDTYESHKEKSIAFVSLLQNNPSLLQKVPLRDDPSAYALFFRNAKGELNNKTVGKDVQKNTINAEYKKKRKKIYNNVYTLSHRERWDNDKEWQFFSLYSFGVKDYTDFPIYTYKNRLSSVLQSIDFSYSQAEKHKNRALTAPKGEIEIKQSNSFYSGAGIVQQLLNELDFYEIKKLDKQNRLLLYQINKDIFKQKKKIQTSIYNKKLQTELKELCKKRDLLIRRTKLVRKIFRKNTNPSSMVLTIIPVLPPDLRPIVKMGNQIAASDLNRLYQRVIYRNERLKKFLKDPATSQSYEMKYAQRLLQEAVDNLMQNGKSGPNSEKDGRGRALKSLSDILKGKQGRFRQFLLGKRVDYSGRSVIVVGPKLKLYECGLPVEMAKELYLPFLLKRILNKNYAKTVVGAKTLIQKNPSLANELLREIMQVSPVLLNRAPTLHRLGIQAFIPKLIEGRAILLHPLVCAAFNADFDGDQMAVHVPITIEARAEAWKMMLSRNNILSPATGDPLAIPSQDMVLGCYYLTTFSNKSIKKSKNLLGSGMYFKNFNDVIKLYEQQLLDIHALVWVKFGDSYLSSLQNKKYMNNFSTAESAFAEAKASLVTGREKSLDFLAVKRVSLMESTQSIKEKQRIDKKAIIKNETPIQKIELIENENDQEDLFEIRISPFGQWQEITSNSHKLYDVNQNLISQYICTTPGRILFNLVIQKTIDKE